MSINLKQYEKEITFDLPVSYWSHNIKENEKNNDNRLIFYPISIKDIFDFYKYVGCLLTDHTSELDKKLPIEIAMKIISMTQYEYLWWSTCFNNEVYLYQFCLLLSLCMKENKFENITKRDLNKEFSDIFIKPKDNLGKPCFQLNGIVYDGEDFDNIKELICYQNEIELPDTSKSKSFRDAIELARKRKMKIMGSNKIVDIEDQLICLSLGYGIPYIDVSGVSLRKFHKMIDYMNKKTNYEIYLTASLSGFVEFKDKSILKHWMLADDKGKYDDILIDADQFQDKIDDSNKYVGKGKKTNRNN